MRQGLGSLVFPIGYRFPCRMDTLFPPPILELLVKEKVSFIGYEFP